jgi:hypothetical protein
MPVNWQLGLNQGPDPITRVRSAFDEGFQRAGERKAAGALAQGNAQGALDAYARMGNTAGVERVNTQQREQAQRESDNAWNREKQGREREGWEQQDKERLRGDVLRVAYTLLQTPEQQRAGRYQTEAIPLLQRMGVPDEVIQQGLADGVLSDQDIREFILSQGGEIPGRNIEQVGDALVEIDPYAAPGTAPSSIYTAPPEPERASPGWEVMPDGSWRPKRGGPYDPETIRQQSGIRREVIVENPVPRQGGSGGGASSGSKPWERRW